MQWDEAEWTFSPYVSWRRGTVPFALLRPLVPAKAWALIEEGQELREERGRLTSVLLPPLRAAVQHLAGLHMPMIQLQRDLHNDRTPAVTTVEMVRQHLPPVVGEALEAWCATSGRESDLMARAQLELEAELREAERVLSTLAATEEVALGLHLSARSLVESVRRLATLRLQHDDKRARRTRQTLVSFLFRIALKPSPFGTFTDVGAHAWTQSPGLDHQIRRREVRLSRMLLDWMEYELCRLEDCRDQLPLRVNNTVRQSDACVQFLSRGPNGSPHMFGAERFVRLPITEPLLAILKLASGSTTSGEVMIELGRLGIPEDRLRTYLERLVEIGLLERSLGLPDQEPEYARAMSEALRHVTGERAATCTAALAEMTRIESAMAEASSVSRMAQMAELSQAVERFATAVDRPVPDDEAAPYFYENGVSTGVGASWDAGLLEREGAMLGLIVQVLRLFDFSTIERLGLYRLFVETAGTDGSVDLLDFYHSFAKLGIRVISELMRGAGDHKAREVSRLARDFFDHVSTHDTADGTMRLDEGWLRTFVAGFPAFLSPLPSVSVRLQRITSEGSVPLWVVNGVGPGHGSRFSRFCSMPNGAHSDWSLHAAVAEQIRRRWPRQADLAVVLGVNTNIHPPLSAIEVEYPRSRANRDAGRVLHLSDLMVRADHERSCLMLIDKADGRRIDLVPLTFLFPAGGPSLYRFLFGFGPFLNPPRRIWDNVPALQSGNPVCLPRLQVGHFSLERRTWRVPTAILKVLTPIRPRSVEGMLALERMRVSLDLPRECFFRVLLDESQNPDAEWADEPQHWAVEARRSRREKPHYIDFRNPLLTELLLKRLVATEVGTVLFQECLPSTAEYADDAAPKSAEEYVVELNHCGAP
jgi:hypothetical protein